MESFKSVVYALRDRYLPYHEGRRTWQEGITGLYTLCSYTVNRFDGSIVVTCSHLALSR